VALRRQVFGKTANPFFVELRFAASSYGGKIPPEFLIATIGAMTLPASVIIAQRAGLPRLAPPNSLTAPADRPRQMPVALFWEHRFCSVAAQKPDTFIL
jgi:hypothetical protein